MKKLFTLFMVLVLISLAACGTKTSTSGDGKEKAGDGEKKEKVTIGISQIVEHPSLDGAREGFIAALKDNGYIEGENLKLDVQIAQGDMSANKTIAQKFVADKADLILAIATPSAQAVVGETKDIPVLFTAITDPVSAGLVKSFEKPEGNATGTSDTHPEAIPNTIQIIHDFFPDAKNIGIIYNSGEQNSEINVKRAKEKISELGLKAVEATISTSSEVKQAAESLVGRADVIYIPKDNTVVSALESVVTIANDKDIPLFVGESDSVKRGGFAGYGFEYHDLGYQTGLMAIEILNGKKPSEIPAKYPDTLDLVINAKAAKEQGIEITDAMKKNAKIIE